MRTDPKYIELKEIIGAMSMDDKKKRIETIKKLKENKKKAGKLTPTIEKRLDYMQKMAELIQ